LTTTTAWKEKPQQFKAPMVVSHRIGHGIDAEKARKSLEHHRRKIVGTQRALLSRQILH
jgi:hypothetical protein